MIAGGPSSEHGSHQWLTEAEHEPLAVLGRDRAPFRIYDSSLSEYAALGFEYGYSVAHPDALVLWEALFGDFANGAQIIIDQFVVAAEDKWATRSGLALLVPHGFEGQGPEHSSARLERFLSACAEDNIRVAYPTTAARYFHLLRRQGLTQPRKPLVVMIPKRYLRMPATRSTVDELVSGASTRCSPTRGRPQRYAGSSVLSLAVVGCGQGGAGRSPGLPPYTGAGGLTELGEKTPAVA